MLVEDVAAYNGQNYKPRLHLVLFISNEANGASNLEQQKENLQETYLW